MKYIFLAITVITLASCGGNDKKIKEPPRADTAGNPQTQIAAPAKADTTLENAKPFIEKEFAKWAQSFNKFHIDSFKWYQKTDFESLGYESGDDLPKFYELYKNSLSFSPDSNQFIDLYSAGLMLEKRGKKIVASADVDNGVTLYNRQTKEWNRILFFGPSAWIEEAVWISPTNFVLAGVAHNDDGDTEAFMILGNTNDKSFQWFKSDAIRAHSSKYEASGMGKLKIDEWE